MTPFGFRTVSPRMLIDPVVAPVLVPLLRPTCIANVTGTDIYYLSIRIYRSIVPVKGTAHNTETVIPEISKAAPTIRIM